MELPCLGLVVEHGAWTCLGHMAPLCPLSGRHSMEGKLCLPVSANGEGVGGDDCCGPQVQRLGRSVTRRQGVCCAWAAMEEWPHCVSIPLRHLLSMTPVQA